MKKKNGFTLIELLLVIALVAVISLAVGINSSSLLKRTNEKKYRETYSELFDAALVYSSLPSVMELETNNCTESCTITLSTLISKGLVDKEILNQVNPLYGSSVNFSGTDQIYMIYQNGEKKFSFKANSCILNEDDLNDTEWGRC